MNRLTFAIALICAATSNAQDAKDKDDPFKIEFKKTEPRELTPEEKKRAEEAVKAIAGAGAAAGTCAIVSFGLIAFGILFLSAIPIVIALYRGHPDTAGISLVSIFLGWTFIGWILALVWSVKSFARTKQGRARDY